MQSIDEEPEQDFIQEKGKAAVQEDKSLKIFQPLAGLISQSYANSKSWSVLGPVIGDIETRVLHAGESLFPTTMEKLKNSSQPFVQELDKQTANVAFSVRASVSNKIQYVQDQLASVTTAYTKRKQNLKTLANEVFENANASAKPAYEKVQAANKKLGSAVSAVAHSITQIQEILSPKGRSLNRELRSRVHQGILAATSLSSQSATLLKGTFYDAKKRGPRGSAAVLKHAFSSSAAFIMASPQEFANSLNELQQEDGSGDSPNRGKAEVLVKKLQTLLHACNTVFVLPLSAAVQAAVDNAKIAVEEAEVQQSELELSALEKEINKE